MRKNNLTDILSEHIFGTKTAKFFIGYENFILQYENKDNDLRQLKKQLENTQNTYFWSVKIIPAIIEIYSMYTFFKDNNINPLPGLLLGGVMRLGFARLTYYSKRDLEIQQKKIINSSLKVEEEGNDPYNLYKGWNETH